MRELHADIAVIGGGLGGVAAALAAAAMGRNVVLTEETAWLGGQLTTQAVPPDEHPWIDTVGGSASYRALRTRIRDYYRRNYPLLEQYRAEARFNPGMGFVSELCAEPRVAVACIDELLAPHRASGRLRVLKGVTAVAVEVEADHICSVTLREERSTDQVVVTANVFIDATELGDLLELGGIEHVIGAEGQPETGEPHALPEADPLNQQSHSWCFAMDYLPGEDHTVERPATYDDWRRHRIDGWPDVQLSWTVSHPITLEPQTRPLFAGDSDEPLVNDLWHFRRILYRRYYPVGAFQSDITIANWPQLDYTKGPLLGVSAAERDTHLRGAMDLSLSMMHWMQTEAPTAAGGQGYPGLRLRGDVTGTKHGLAMAPYVREARRIRAEFTVLEQHISKAERASLGGAEEFADSVGTGSYRIDLHPSTRGRNYVDISTYPFQIPLGALLPVRVDNLLPAGKNIGTTHVTNGCYRLHPVEWSIGEAVGALAAFSLDVDVVPRGVRASPGLLSDFQALLSNRFQACLSWPESIRRVPRDLPFGTCDAYGKTGEEDGENDA